MKIEKVNQDIPDFSEDKALFGLPKPVFQPPGRWSHNQVNAETSLTSSLGVFSFDRAFDSVIAEKQKKSNPTHTDFVSFLDAYLLNEKGEKVEIDNMTRIQAALLDWGFANKVHVSLIIAPGIGKSTIARQKMVWELAKQNDLRTVIVQGTVNDASQSVSLCRSLISYLPLMSDFGVKVVNDDVPVTKTAKQRAKADKRGFSRNEWYLHHSGQAKDPQMQACPLELSGESRRVDIALFDDIVGEKTAFSAELTKRAERAFWNTWIDGRLSNGGWAIYLQNLRNATDLAHKLREDPRFISVWIGVEDDLETMFMDIYNPYDRCPLVERPKDFQAEYQCEENEGTIKKIRYHIPKPVRLISNQGRIVNKWSKEEIAKINPSALRRLYMLKASAAEDLMFPHFAQRQFMGATPNSLKGCAMVGDVPVFDPLERNRYTIVGGLDWSASKRAGKALTFIVRDLATNRYAPIWHKRIKGTIIDLVSELNRLWASGFHWDMLMNEKNNVQEELGVAIKALAGRDADGEVLDWANRITNFQTTADKWSIENGLPQMNVAMYEGRLMWFESMKDISFEWYGFENEMMEMRLDTNKMTPDSIMSLWFAWRGHQTVMGGTRATLSQTPAVIRTRTNDKWRVI
jgi:hypothetical protein